MGRNLGKNHDKVAGLCPQGCGETLFLGSGGHVTCSWVQCPNPTSVDELLGDAKTTTHVVHYDQRGVFSIQHPLRERLTLGIELTLCSLHEFLSRRDPMQTGWYEAAKADSGWKLAPIPRAVPG